MADLGPAARGVRVVHGAITGGLTTIGVLSVVLVRLLSGPVLESVAGVGMGLGLAGLALVLYAVAVFRQSVVPRRGQQPIEEYWNGESSRAPALRLWVLLEGGGMLSTVGYVFSGSVLPGAVAVLAVAALLGFRPAHFEGD
jgi:hypothetical protein